MKVSSASLPGDCWDWHPRIPRLTCAKTLCLLMVSSLDPLVAKHVLRSTFPFTVRLGITCHPPGLHPDYDASVVFDGGACSHLEGVYKPAPNLPWTQFRSFSFPLRLDSFRELCGHQTRRDFVTICDITYSP